MKKLLAILTLTFLTLAANAGPYFAGAWYCTKAATLGNKQAGGLDVYFYDDNTIDFDIYLGGQFYIETVEVTYIDTGKFYTFTVVDSDGWVWKGKLVTATGLLTGTFTGTGGQKGKFQCVLDDDGEAVAAAGKKKRTGK